MGVYLKYIDPGKVFRDADCPKIILNDMRNRSTEDKQNINNMLMLTVGEEFDNIPRCSCGNLSTNIYLNVTCPLCDTPVEQVIPDKLDDKLWVRSPEGVAPFMHPMMWLQLYNYLDKSNFNILRWLTDSGYTPTKQINETVRKALVVLDEHDLNVRDYNHFYEKHEQYFDLLLNHPAFNNNSKTEGRKLHYLFTENKDILWQEHIQVPNKAINIIESVNGRKWIDSSSPVLMGPLRLMTGIDNQVGIRNHSTLRTRKNYASRFSCGMAEYYTKSLYSKVLGRKHGVFRKNVYATRSNFSARFVVTAIGEPHDYDEVYFPWAGFVTMFSAHIKKKLKDKGKYTPRQIISIVNRSVRLYSEEIHEIINELIDESKTPHGKRGIPVLLNRNPTLYHGSIVQLRVTRVKTNVTDNSASTSGTIAKLYNGDYDGDEETFKLLLDNRTARAAFAFEPMFSAGDISNPYGIHDVLALPKQTAMAISMIGETPLQDADLKALEQYLD